MLANQRFGRNKKIYAGLMLALIMSLLAPVVQPQPAHAQEEEFGYLWSLYWDFNSDYNAVLTIEVGPWKDGDLVEVLESSTTTVRCTPEGSVGLAGGTARFKGGHLNCAMDLGAIVLQNHGLVIDEIDNYGSIFAQTSLKSTSPTVAPIFTHQDAQYHIDFTQTSSVTLGQKLWNNAGLLQLNIATVALNTWRTFGYLYICNPSGTACDAFFSVDGPNQIVAAPGGHRALFNTGPTSFTVGGAGLNGKMDWLLIDPGNSAH